MYEQTVKLKDNEKLVKVNDETGETFKINKRVNNVPEGRIKWSNGNFKQPSSLGMKWVYDNFNSSQVAMIFKLIEMSGRDNTLKPLNDGTQISMFEDLFKLSKNTIKKNLDVLFKKGIYAKFELYEVGEELTKYWVLNPYLSVNQGTVLDKVHSLFINTELAIYCLSNNRSFTRK